MDYDKLIEQLRTESLYADKASLEIMDLCMDAATAIETLRAENRRLNEVICSIPTTPDSGRTISQYDKEMSMCAYLDDLEAENKSIRADLARVTAERDAAQALLAERSGVTGSAPITTAFGVSLDRLRELAQADREGRCGIPPVKMHQKLFRVFNGEIHEETVCGAMWEPLMPRPRWKVFVMGSGLPYYWDDVFGKTVFLTRAAAEAALKAREQDG